MSSEHDPAYKQRAWTLGVNTAVLVTLLGNLGMFVYSYGKLSERVDALTAQHHRLADRVERWLESERLGR